MDKQEILLWASERCSELVNGYLIAHDSDWHDIDRPNLVRCWDESEDGFTFILCMRKTGSDTIHLDRNRPIDEVVTDINNKIIKIGNEKFYIIHPYFKRIDAVSPLEALSWSMYLFRDKYRSMEFEASGTIKVEY